MVWAAFLAFDFPGEESPAGFFDGARGAAAPERPDQVAPGAGLGVDAAVRLIHSDHAVLIPANGLFNVVVEAAVDSKLGGTVLSVVNVE